MFQRVISGGITSVESYIVNVEVDISKGMPFFDMVGLLSGEVKEAKERVRIALKNSGVFLPPQRITVNLSPAYIRKGGSAFDLPIAVGILAATGHLKLTDIHISLFIGEMSLDGKIRKVKGALAIVLMAKKMGLKYCYIPQANLKETTIVEGITIVGISELSEIIEGKYISGKKQYNIENINEKIIKQSIVSDQENDFDEVTGQEYAKRAIEIAAAGNHNILLIGAAGVGKTMLAKRIPSILPPMTREESLEVTKIYSIAGLLQKDESIMYNRPFRAPHHSISVSALAGGGRYPAPGEITLAQNGVLFLDELPEFAKRTIEVLRKPLEEKKIELSRLQGTYYFPADFLFVGAMNPCRCGFYPDRSKCNCSEREIAQYLGRISQPILDRIDLSVEVTRTEYGSISGKIKGESSIIMRNRIIQARLIQKERFLKYNITTNSEIRPQHINTFCNVDSQVEKFLEQAYDYFELNARSYHKILKVARTIADLEGTEQIKEHHVNEAVCYRTITKKVWGR